MDMSIMYRYCIIIPLSQLQVPKEQPGVNSGSVFPIYCTTPPSMDLKWVRLPNLQLIK